MADKYLRNVEQTSTGKEVTRYKLNGKLIKAAEVPEGALNALGNVEPGVEVEYEGGKAQAQNDNQTTDQGSDDFNLPPIPSEEVLDSAKDGDEPTTAPEVDSNESTPAPAPTQEPTETKSRPRVKAVKTVDGVREDERPGGPQEPNSPASAITIDSADDVDDDSGLDVEEQDRAARMRAGQEQDEAGMGFPRKDGKTVDIFDGKTPHTQVRYVAGIMVPLSDENAKNKSDGEIIDKLRKMGKVQ